MKYIKIWDDSQLGWTKRTSEYIMRDIVPAMQGLTQKCKILKEIQRENLLNKILIKTKGHKKQKDYRKSN